MKFDILA